MKRLSACRIPPQRWARCCPRSSSRALPASSTKAAVPEPKSPSAAIVLENTTPDMRVFREEIFGPVVCATPFGDDDLDHIAKRANDTIYGLAASVWTRNDGTAHKLARRIRSGTVWINCHNVFDASLPSGGYRQSGWGREMGEEVFHNCPEVKAVTAAL
jgi:phenylacetaldehyde dehydrogenase